VSELTPVSEVSEEGASPHQPTTPFHNSMSSSAFTPFVDGSNIPNEDGELTPMSVEDEQTEKSRVRFLIKNKQVTPSKLSKSPMTKKQHQELLNKGRIDASTFENRCLKALLVCIPIIFVYFSKGLTVFSNKSSSSFSGQLVQSSGNLAATTTTSSSIKQQPSFYSPSASTTSLQYSAVHSKPHVAPIVIVPKINVQNLDQTTLSTPDLGTEQQQQQQNSQYGSMPSRNQLNQEAVSATAATVAASLGRAPEGTNVKTLLISGPVKVQIIDAEDGACFRWKRGLFGGHGSWRKECKDDSWWVVRPAGEKGLQMQHYKNGKCLCPKRCHEENVNFVLRSCERCACGNGWQLDQTTQILTWQTTVVMESKQYWASEETAHEDTTPHQLSACLARRKNKASSKMCYHDEVRKVMAKTQETSVLPSGRSVNSLAVYDGISTERKERKTN